LCAIGLVLLLSGSVWAIGAKDVVVDVLVESDSSWDGRLLPDYPRGRPEISILKINVPPGARLPQHKHNVINAGVLTKGELTVVTEENKIMHLKAGDPLVEVVNTWHYGKNEGNTDAEIIVFYAGSPGTPITVKQ